MLSLFCFISSVVPPVAVTLQVEAVNTQEQLRASSVVWLDVVQTEAAHKYQLYPLDWVPGGTASCPLSSLLQTSAEAIRVLMTPSSVAACGSYTPIKLCVPTPTALQISQVTLRQ